MINLMCRSVLELISYMLIISAISGKRGKRILAGSTILVILEVFLVYLDNQIFLSDIGMFLPYMVMAVGVYLIYRDPVLSCVLYCIIAFVLLSVMEVVFYLLFMGSLEKRLGVSAVQSVCTFAIFAIVILCYICQWIHFETIRKYIHSKRYLLCYLCVLLLIAFQMARYQYFSTRIMPVYTFFGLIFLVVLFSPLIFSYIRNETELRLRSKYEQPIMDILTRIRQQQHQYDHQLNTIYGMLHHYKTYDELATHLKEYLADIEGADPCYSLVTELEDPLLAGFLGVKFSHAANMEIEVEHEIAVKTIQSNVSLPELVGILGNVIDNAIEEVAVHSLPRKIRIRIWEESDWYRIRLGNPCRETVTDLIGRFFERGFSTKDASKDGVGQRGLGLCSVADTVNRYKGQVSATTELEEDINWFYIQIRIKKTDREKVS